VELPIGPTEEMLRPIWVVIAHERAVVIADAQPRARVTQRIPLAFPLAEGDCFGAGHYRIQRLLEDAPKVLLVLDVKVAGVHIPIVLDDHIVAAFFLDMADLWSVPGVGQ
jgi:hypothetical protein